MSDLDGKYSINELSELFKTTYGKPSDEAFNTSTLLMAKIRRSNNFIGNDKKMLVPVGYQGGRGAGILPEFSNGSYVQPTLTRKRHYARARYDRETIKASSGSDGAFYQGTSRLVKGTVDTYGDMMSIFLHGQSNGALGTIGAAVTGSGTTGSPYVCTISVGTWIPANWTKNDLVNVDTSVDKFKIQSINRTNRTVSLVIQAGGTQVPADTDLIYLQGSKDAVITGLGQAMSATSGTMWGVTIDDSFKVSQIDGSGAALTLDDLIRASLDAEEFGGKGIQGIHMPYNQYRRILNQMEDKKVIEVSPRDKALTGRISYKAIALETPHGDVPLIPDKYMLPTEVWGLNYDEIEIMHAPDHGWFDDDGKVFHRMSEDDAYEARFGGYSEMFAVLNHQVRVHSLAT